MPAPRPPRSCWARPTPSSSSGAIVARELYGTTIPVVVATESDLRTDDLAIVRADEKGVELRS